MQTLRAGTQAILRRPPAALPLTVEGLLFAVLLLVGVLPATPAMAPAAAAWPLDLYFDLKQSVALSSSWPSFSATLFASVLFRSTLLAMTAALADGPAASLLTALRNALRLGSLGVVLLLPVAALYFVAVAIRYAPFAWIAGGLGLVVGWWLCRRGVGLDSGLGARGRPVPELSSFLLYTVAVMSLGLAVTSLGDGSVALAALLVACAGPFHALVWLGWRHRGADGVTSPEGRVVATLGFLIIAAFFVASGVDRNLRDYEVVPANSEGSLLLLGGADSTSRTGALVDLDPNALGYPRSQTELLSYAPDGGRYVAAHTRADLDRIAERVAEQIDRTRAEPVVLLGHSQASLILDRIHRRGVDLDAAAVISPSPARPPSLEVPPPGRNGTGRVGGDLARSFAVLLDVANLASYDIDVPSAPVYLERVEVADAGMPRLALWALGDSILLESDWRRTGETNLVVFSDHVGATRNPRALEVTRLFLKGEEIAADDGSWRSILVNVFRYAFEPWRPAG